MPSIFPPARHATAMLLLLGLVAAGAVAQQPSPPPSVDPLDRLQAAFQAAERDNKKQPEADAETVLRRSSRAREMPAFIQNVRDALARDDDATALTYLGELRSLSDSEEMRNACDTIIGQIKKTRADRDTVYTAKVDDAVKHAAQAVMSAKTPKDLDAILQEFGQLGVTRSNRYNDGSNNNIYARVQAAVTFLNHWQDYLFAVERGDEQSASNSLRNVADNNNGSNLPPLIPRSEILARMPANRGLNEDKRDSQHTETKLDAAVEALLDHTRTLGEIPTTLASLDKLRAEFGDKQLNYNYNSVFGTVQTALQNFEKTRLELQAGLGTTINLAPNRADTGNSHPGIEARLVTLRAELILMALPRLLNAPDEKAVTGEGVDVFLRRLIETAKKRADWTAVMRGLDLVRSLATGSNGYASSNSQETDAFKQFFAGMNMESAGQYQPAVIAYLNALKTGVQDLPTALIGERLAGIQKEHPSDYAAASLYSLNPPVQASQNYPFGPRSAYDPRVNRSGYPGGAEQAPPSSKVTVPAASPWPSSSVVPSVPKVAP